MEKMNKRKIGSVYEQKAVDYLKNHSYIIVEQNYFCKYGEIDIIAKEADVLVFVEVKYRKDTKAGLGESAVNKRKQIHIINSAQNYMLEKYKTDEVLCRFDVIAINGNMLHHIKNAFDGWN